MLGHLPPNQNRSQGSPNLSCCNLQFNMFSYINVEWCTPKQSKLTPISPHAGDKNVAQPWTKSNRIRPQCTFSLPQWRSMNQTIRTSGLSSAVGVQFPAYSPALRVPKSTSSRKTMYQLQAFSRTAPGIWLSDLSQTRNCPDVKAVRGSRTSRSQGMILHLTPRDGRYDWVPRENSWDRYSTHLRVKLPI